MAIAQQKKLPLDQKEENLHFGHLGPWERMQQVEAWLDEQVGTLPHGQWWVEDYRLLRAQGWRWKDAFIVVWMSLGSDDRGPLSTVQALTEFLGVSRQWYYNRLEKWPVMERIAERLQLRRLRGARLAAVDERSYTAAVEDRSSAADRKLYYQRAGVWQEQVALIAEKEGPEDYRDVRSLSAAALQAEIEQLQEELEAEEAGEVLLVAAGEEAPAGDGGADGTLSAES